MYTQDKYLQGEDLNARLYIWGSKIIFREKNRSNCVRFSAEVGRNDGLFQVVAVLWRYFAILEESSLAK